MGVPSVPIITKAYLDLAKSTAAQRGMPTLRIAYTVQTGAGPATVQGAPGYELRIVAIPNDPPSEPETDEDGFFTKLGEGLLVVGAVAIVVVAVAGAPETGGGSLTLLLAE